MSVYTKFSDETLHTTTLPQMFIHNPRERIKAEQVPVEDLVVKDEEETVYETQVVPYPMKRPPVPTPKFPLEMICNPKMLCFVLDEEPVTLRVRIWNSSDRSLYFQYYGLWGDMARIGASWCCYPRTRIWLPSGLWTEFIVKATPRENCPIAFAIARMQLAAGHMRDNVTGYFSIPIQAKFLKFTSPPSAEGDYSVNRTPVLN